MLGAGAAATLGSTTTGVAAAAADGAAAGAAPAEAVVCSRRSSRADKAAISALIAAISALALGCARTGVATAKQAATQAAARVFRIDFAPVFPITRGGANATGIMLRVSYSRVTEDRPSCADPGRRYPYNRPFQGTREAHAGANAGR